MIELGYGSHAREKRLNFRLNLTYKCLECNFRQRDHPLEAAVLGEVGPDGKDDEHDGLMEGKLRTLFKGQRG